MQGQLGNGMISNRYHMTLAVQEPYYTQDFIIEVWSTYTVSGTVTFNGVPQEGLIITYTTDGGETYQTAVTDTDGIYSINAYYDVIVEITDVSHPTLTSTISQTLPLSCTGGALSVDFDLTESTTHDMPDTSDDPSPSLWYLLVLLVPVILVLIGHGYWLAAKGRTEEDV